jgi:hypothetical protein
VAVVRLTTEVHVKGPVDLGGSRIVVVSKLANPTDIDAEQGRFCRELSAKQIEVIGNRPFAVRTVHLRVLKVRTRQVGSDEVCFAQTRTGQDGAGEIG